MKKALSIVILLAILVIGLMAAFSYQVPETRTYTALSNIDTKIEQNIEVNTQSMAQNLNELQSSVQNLITIGETYTEETDVTTTFEQFNIAYQNTQLLQSQLTDLINMDLTNSQMTQVVLETDIMNYFSFQQILSQLMDSKFIKPYKDSGREYYCLTQKGLETLEYFLNRIPESYAQKIDEYIKNNKESLLADTQVKSSFVKQSENEFIVNLRVIENQSNLIDLNLNVSSEKQARQICNNWNNNASNMYAEVINLLIRDIH